MELTAEPRKGNSHELDRQFGGLAMSDSALCLVRNVYDNEPWRLSFILVALHRSPRPVRDLSHLC